MKILFSDKSQSVKINFLESLVLMYLPCESFSENDDGTNTLFGDAYEEDGKYYVNMTLKVGKSVETECVFKNIDKSKKLQMKNLIGSTFLVLAEKIFGYKPPFGIATGIRPAKLAADYLSFCTSGETKDILINEYGFDKVKAELCVKCAENEISLVKDRKDKEFSLYISVPFCPSKCKYCSFVSASTPKLLSLLPDYIKKITSEIPVVAKTAKDIGLTLKSIYVGGGTPGILSCGQIEDIISEVYKNFDTSYLSEFTFELGRPDTVTGEKLSLLHKMGATRICINTQTTNDEILRSVGRNHTFEDYKKSMYLAKETGIKCVNTDLIAGLPGESTKSFIKSVEDVLECDPENITIHAFTLKKSSEYMTRYKEKIDANSTTAREMIDIASLRLLSQGFFPYYMYKQKNTVGNLENTGYSKKGFESLYNVYMMGEYHTVLSVGAGSVSKYVSRYLKRIERVFSPKYPYEYLDKEKYSGFDENFAKSFYENLY